MNSGSSVYKKLLIDDCQLLNENIHLHRFFNQQSKINNQQ